jgi:sugar phosphate isomerase/epimerase
MGQSGQNDQRISFAEAELQRFKENEPMSNTSRRSFLKATAAVAAAVGAGSIRLAAKPVGVPIGLQLYSVRELLPKDFDGTLAKVRAAGYTEVEAAGYFDRTAAVWRHSMDQAGLRCTSTHHALALLLEHGDELIEYGHALGLEYIICPWPRRRDPALTGELTLDDWRWVAGELNRIGEKVKAAGMVFGYHNHGPEFGWAAAAGHNPLNYLSKTPERFPLLHVKDMVKGANGEYHSTVMGRGVVDYRPILRAATGLKHYFIEQEEFDMDTMEALRLDAEYMRKLSI